MRIFLDVGTHEGQTLAEVTKPRWEFDKVVGFEPMHTQRHIAEDAFPSVAIMPFGLSDRTAVVKLYGDNSKMEASVFATHRDADQSITTDVLMVRATDFVQGLGRDHEIVMKLNCEGSEAAILTDLAESGMIHRLSNVLVDFDVRKCSGHQLDEARVVRLLDEVGFDRWVRSEDVMIGATHQDRIAAWLTSL